jgi:hypothetical protein
MVDKASASFLVRVWTNGKFAVMKGAKTTPELFACAKMISVLTHVGMGGSAHEACITPLISCNVYLVNVPMKLVLKDSGTGINVICLQRMVVTQTSMPIDPTTKNLRMGFSVGRNTRSNLQQQGNFEVSFLDSKVTLKTFVSSSGNMRIYLATGRPVHMFKTAAETVASVIAPIIHRCIGPRKQSDTTDNNKRKRKKTLKTDEDDEEDEEENERQKTLKREKHQALLEWLGVCVCVKKEEEED